MFWFILVMLLVHVSCGEKVIYHLTKSEYAKMPPLYHLDPYESCLHENSAGVYCFVKFDLVSDQPNPLYDMIQAYSAYTPTHFNHSQLQYGICLTKTCRKFQQPNAITDPTLTLEGCLNSSLWSNYNLKTKINEKVTCDKLDDRIQLDTSDAIVAVLIASILILNLVGSLNDFYNQSDKKQGTVLSCFSILRNWEKLTGPTFVGPELRIMRLKGFCGIRTMTTALVIFAHSLLPFVVVTDNPHYLEEAYYNKFYSVVVNGTLVVQTFFIMSGFMLAFNFLLYEESHQISWSMLPRTILLRWLRLTPTYAVVLAITMTWLRYAGSGPLWQLVVNLEVEHCRRDWWLNLLYVNNYVDYSHCMPQTWYLASDLQLHVVGLVCMLAAPRRKTILIVLFIAALLMPALHTYYQNLDAMLVVSPEASRNFYITDPTFNNTYKRGHTNLASFVIGLTLGLLVYKWQKTNYQFNKYVSHRYLQWLTVPGMLGVILLGRLFFQDGPPVSIYYRALFAAVIKPIYASIVALLIIGMVFKFENVYSSILEWGAWLVPSRISYSAFIIHLTVIRYLTGTRTTLVHMSLIHLAEVMISSVVLSFLLAIPMYLLVEAPLQSLVKTFTSQKNNVTNEKTDEKVTKTLDSK